MRCAFHPLTQKKAKTQQQPQPTEQPSTQEMFMMREYTPAEIIDTTAKF